MDIYTACASLLIVTVITSFCADYRESRSPCEIQNSPDVRCCTSRRCYRRIRE